MKGFVCWLAMLILAIGASQTGEGARGPTVRVVVWDEQQPAQKQAYEDFLGNAIADYLKQHGEAKRGAAGLTMRSVRLDDPEQGLPREVLDNCDVLIWWAHARHGEVKDELAKDIVKRIQSGRLSLIALHSAHWSKPFMEAMNARAIADALNTLVPGRQAVAKVETIAPPRRLMRADEPLTPSATVKDANPCGPVVEVRLPSCVFPAVRNDGKPSHVQVLMKKNTPSRAACRSGSTSRIRRCTVSHSTCPNRTP